MGMKAEAAARRARKGRSCRIVWINIKWCERDESFSATESEYGEDWKASFLESLLGSWFFFTASLSVHLEVGLRSWPRREINSTLFCNLNEVLA